MKAPRFTPAEQAVIEAGLRADLGFRSDAAIIGENSRQCQSGVTPWFARRVDEFVSITFVAQRWCVLDLPDVHVGDLVYCLPTPQGDGLRVRSANAQLPDIWASRFEPFHSHPHIAPPAGTHESLGKQTSVHAPGHQCSCPCGQSARTPQTPPAASPLAHKPRHKPGKAGAAPGAPGCPTVLVLHVHLAPQQRSKGNGKRRLSSWSESFKG
jgi:hypothetical protein